MEKNVNITYGSCFVFILVCKFEMKKVSVTYESFAFVTFSLPS